MRYEMEGNKADATSTWHTILSFSSVISYHSVGNLRGTIFFSFFFSMFFALALTSPVSDKSARLCLLFLRFPSVIISPPTPPPPQPSFFSHVPLLLFAFFSPFSFFSTLSLFLSTPLSSPSCTPSPFSTNPFVLLTYTSTHSPLPFSLTHSPHM